MPATASQLKTPEQKTRSGKRSSIYTSPNVNARVEEKQELSHLNDRLAAYIDRVRSLESQNAKLSVEVNQAIDTRNKEVTNVKAMYETELAESRRLLDDTSKEKALLKLENNKLNGILEDLRPKLQQEQAANKQLQDKLRSVERTLNEKVNLLASYTTEKREMQSRLKDLEAQLEDLENKLAKDKEQLEKEIIARIDAENRYQTLKEESQFNAQIHISEVNEARQSAQTMSVSVDETTGSAHYDGILRDKLQDLREEFEEEAENARQELEDAYQLKFEEMKSQSEKDQLVVSKLLEKQEGLKGEVDALKSTNSVLSAKVESFQKRVSELDGLRVLDREEFRSQLEASEEKLKLLQSRYSDLESEYETLLGIKIALDMELSAYNKLLEGEERRLNLTTPEKTPRRARKRGFRDVGESSSTTCESTSTGAVAIGEVDPAGVFVTVTNSGLEEEGVGGFFVHQAVDGKDATNDFKFPADHILLPQQSVTIWSESQGVKPNPPNEFVLGGDWMSGGTSLETTVVNSESEIIAKHTLTTTTEQTETSHKVRKEASKDSCIVM